MRFPMTTDGWVKGTTLFTLVAIAASWPAMLLAVDQPATPKGIHLFVGLTLGAVGLLLVGTVLAAPRAVRLTANALIVERLVLPDFELAWSEVTGVQEAPALELMGQVRRVAGNSGLMGFTGLYSVAGVGTVRCFATRLHRPTVLVSRRGRRPLLLGVDEPHRLLEVLRRRPLTRSARRLG